METLILPVSELHLKWEDIWNESGYAGFVPDDETAEIFEDVKKEISSVARPAYGYEIFRNEGSSPYCLRLGGITLDSGKTISGYLREAEEFIVFTATAGREFEEIQRRFSLTGDIVAGFFADLIGSAIAERTGRVLHEKIRSMQDARKYRTSPSYSPGYCGWPVSDQKTLFSLLPPEPCGITLTGSQLMVPIKSVSGIIGVGKELKSSPHSCEICEMKNCFRRHSI